MFLTSPLFLFKRSSTLLPGTEVIVWDKLESPLLNILFTTKLLSLYPLSWDMDCLLTLWPLLIPRSLGKGCCTFGFLIFIIVERNFLYNSLYILTERSLKHLCSIRAWVPVSFFLSFSLSLPLIAWSTETHLAHSPARASKTLSRRHPVPSPLLERVPSAFMRDANPVSRALLVFSVNQGISTCLSLSPSYRHLWIARSRSIKAPQHLLGESHGRRSLEG